MRYAGVVAMVLVLSGCRDEPPGAPVRPHWRYSVDGIAPLMPPREVRAALERRGYRQIACTGGRPPLADPMHSGDSLPCFVSPSRRMRVSLYFLDLNEGRRLAVANFRAVLPDDATNADRSALSRRVDRYLRARLGPPLTSQPGPLFHSYYWGMSGGNPSLPDLISTTVGEDSEANVTLTSFWAYGNVRQGGADTS